jgi:hypothetical protein
MISQRSAVRFLPISADGSKTLAGCDRTTPSLPEQSATSSQKYRQSSLAQSCTTARFHRPVHVNAHPYTHHNTSLNASSLRLCVAYKKEGSRGRWSKPPLAQGKVIGDRDSMAVCSWREMSMPFGLIHPDAAAVGLATNDYSGCLWLA